MVLRGELNRAFLRDGSTESAGLLPVKQLEEEKQLCHYPGGVWIATTPVTVAAGCIYPAWQLDAVGLTMLLQDWVARTQLAAVILGEAGVLSC